MTVEALRSRSTPLTGTLTSGGTATLFTHDDDTGNAPQRLTCYVAAQRTFSVAVQFWNGTAWVTGVVYDSSASTTAKGATTSRLNMVQFDIHAPKKCKVILSETSAAGTSDYDAIIEGQGI